MLADYLPTQNLSSNYNFLTETHHRQEKSVSGVVQCRRRWRGGKDRKGKRKRRKEGEEKEKKKKENESI